VSTVCLEREIVNRERLHVIPSDLRGVSVHMLHLTFMCKRGRHSAIWIVVCRFRKIPSRGAPPDRIPRKHQWTSRNVQAMEGGAVPIAFCAACKCTVAPAYPRSDASAATPARDLLLVCEGPCRRELHPVCAGLTPQQCAAALASQEPWVCDQCT
jgi:hypothetical protein